MVKAYDIDRLCASPPAYSIGVDEAGRGPLAGPVVAAAVMLDAEAPIAGLNDSKKLSPKRRDSLFVEIQERALGFAVAEASVAEVDSLNILHASLLAMRRAVDGLLNGNRHRPSLILVDGNRCPAWPHQSEAIVGGDGRVASIAAASILAKVTRDRMMLELDKQYPGYGFARHKGYPTAAHLASLTRLGPCAAHRQSFGPVRQVLQGG